MGNEEKEDRNGIAERTIGLVKEQAIWGHHFQTLEEPRG